MTHDATQRHSLPAQDDVKRQAKALRAALAERGQEASHGQALELVARQYGYRDWNTFHAAIGARPRKFAWGTLAPGERVTGRYLGQPFRAEVLGVQRRVGARTRVTLAFDEPVDVSAFASFSVLRRRVSCEIGADGATVEKTSNGRPHLTLDR